MQERWRIWGREGRGEGEWEEVRIGYCTTLVPLHARAAFTSNSTADCSLCGTVAIFTPTFLLVCISFA